MKNMTKNRQPNEPTTIQPQSDINRRKKKMCTIVVDHFDVGERLFLGGGRGTFLPNNVFFIAMLGCQKATKPK